MEGAASGSGALSGAVVLLTGGSRGIGPFIAQALADRGATLALAARSARTLEAVARTLVEGGARVEAVPVDLREQSERERLVAAVRERLGRIDVLVNNAGLETEGAFTELEWPAVRETVELNLLAPMALTRLVLPEMIGRGSGHVVNVASLAGKTCVPYEAVYSGTKAGLAGWTRALRLELAGTGVRFATIFPGYVRDEGMFAKFGVKAPRIAGSCSPADVARAVARSIERGRVETIVNSRPVRWTLAVNELAPALGDWLMRVSGVVDFQRRKVVGSRGGGAARRGGAPGA